MSTKKRKFITFGSPLICQEEIDEIIGVLKSGWLGTGPKVHKFQNDFKNYKKAKNALAVSSGTAALQLSLISLDLKPEDEVITSAMTFCSTVNSIIHAGATPVIVDIDFTTGNISTQKIIEAINKKTKAIIPVHFAGRPCEMDEIMNIAKNNNLRVIEDCAHSIETEYRDQKVGTIGDFGCFSFYVTKNLATGEGGMILTKSNKAAERIKKLSLHGMNNNAWKRYSGKGYNHYKVEEAGFKFNMTDIQASLGIHQLKRLNKNWKLRKKIWDFYSSHLSQSKLTLPPQPTNNIKLAYHFFPVLVNKTISISRNKLLQCLNDEKIGCGVHYESLPDHPFYRKTYHWKPQNTPKATLFGRSVLSLPISPNLSENDLKYIVKKVLKYVGNK